MNTVDIPDIIGKKMFGFATEYDVSFEPETYDLYYVVVFVIP